MHLGLLAVGVAVLSLGCQRAEPVEATRLARTGLRSEALGCFALFAADGQPVAHPDFYGASPRMLLDTFRMGAQGTLWRMLRRDGSGEVVDTVGNPWLSWSADSLTDTIRVYFSNGHSGVSFAFEVPAGETVDTLRGHVSDNWDFGPPFHAYRGAAMAVRVQCVQPS